MNDTIEPTATAEGIQTNVGLVGSHVHQLKLSRVIDETAEARSLVFEVPEELSEKFRYSPGQFLTLRIPSDLTGSVARCYSLSSSPHTDTALTVTVKRTVDGYGSNWLCDNATAGMSVDMLQPSGVFVPKNLGENFLLMAAGSGITPVMAILKSALSQGSGKVVLIYANRDEKSVIFAEELRRLAAEHPDRLTVIHWLESVQGLPSRASIGTLAAPFREHEAFICGPGPFMSATQDALQHDLGMDHHRVHVEVFQSIEGDPFAEIVFEEPEAGDELPATVTVTLDGTEHTFDWPRGTKLLDLLLSKGLDAPFSCRQGACSACACQVEEGKVDMLVNDILEDEDLADGIVLGCQAVPLTDIVKVTYDG
ncbi:ferredoxin--NADP reductase [Rhodococcus sp. D2-41]|uniref:Ferredoxin--NADP reductase n=1 Tax=Speluncibacter jeojiensis TaxID=2710754 RepID=A0A9X4RDW2_9ACTN|nr:ferredoxin--NADP reductase [Rhodococcus sp. D2-41]MDG3011460.1 ferredoxin--NADP reductase [Rhodococcus sp. D2-41]MDG3015184.1 ferredoxin--NADP reductase [Corynebacteriales bacterium D3-21]